MVVGFSVLRLVPAKTRNALLARPMLLVYAVMGVLGSFIPLFLGSPSAYWLPVERALIGLPCALLLATLSLLHILPRASRKRRHLGC